MTLSEIRRAVYRDCAEARVGNDRITSDELDMAVNETYAEIATIAKCIKSGAYVAAEDDAWLYPFPRTMVDLTAVRIVKPDGTTTPRPLRRTTMKELEAEYPSFRDADSGVPTRYYIYDSRYFGVYPPADTDYVLGFSLEGSVVPSNDVQVGAASFDIESSTNTTPITVTILPTQVGANYVLPSYRLGTWVKIEDHDQDEANGNWRISARTQTGTGASSREIITLEGSEGGASSGTNQGTVTAMGVPPLTKDDDIPELNAQFHSAIVHGTVWRLLSRMLNDEAAMAKAAAAKADYEAKIQAIIDFEASGVRMAALPGVPTTRR